MSEITVHPAGQDPDRIPDDSLPIQNGEWYWVKWRDADEGESDERLACITKVGSNFAEFTTPYNSHTRVHLDQFSKLCRHEPDPRSVIMGYIGHYQEVVRTKLNEIRDVTARLGVEKSAKIERRPEQEASRSLSVLSGTADVDSYKKALVKAKDKELPKLFEEVEEGNKQLIIWMKAQTLPLKGSVDSMKSIVETIEDRIFNVSLYAGLTEEVVCIKNGSPAAVSEKLRIFQRLHYMDEECLLDYKHGGMEFRNIKQFDRWLSKPENLSRLFPFPRCIVAFRVRRGRKDRGPIHSISDIFVRIELEKLDGLTFLYIRNGDQFYRMNCDLEFGPLIFPGRDEFNVGEPLMAKMSFSRVEDVITRRHYEDLLKEEEENERERKVKAEEWRKANPDKKDFFNPHTSFRFSVHELKRDYQPFDPSSVYYDEIKDEIEARVKQYNRIAVIVQGLYDRSEILNPHPPVRLWSPEGFQTVVELVYADHSLYHGDPPDFEAFRKACNASLGKGSITIGQQDYFEIREAEKYNSKSRYGNYRPERHTPPGNRGPGELAEVAEWLPRSSKAVYRWNRERQTSDYWEGKKYGDPIPTHIQVPADNLFNVSAYKPGDFRRFFEDPRTRAAYLRWAPILLTAEEYHAGNIEMPSGKMKKKGGKR